MIRHLLKQIKSSSASPSSHAIQRIHRLKFECFIMFLTHNYCTSSPASFDSPNSTTTSHNSSSFVHWTIRICTTTTEIIKQVDCKICIRFLQQVCLFVISPKTDQSTKLIPSRRQRRTIVHLRGNQLQRVSFPASLMTQNITQYLRLTYLAS